ncbi:MAG: protein translocase subunit SecD [Gemmatimonadota bacterium]|nr:protein translocase subunit SecD [Gemmatimonadota bacterium]
MLSSIRNRLILIGLLVGASIFSLVPRDVTERRWVDGVITDTVVTRIPLKRGLDLKGGMHLALELDQSERVSADPARDIQLALTILRQRVDEFGVTEPNIQQVGDDRIVVELPGIDDPARAKAIVQRNAFLEFRITDETSALERALPAMDRALRDLGITVDTGTGAAPSAVQQLLGGDTTAADSADTTAAPAGGLLSDLIQAAPIGVPGAYMVPETAYLRVDSLLKVDAVERAIPRGVDLFWSAQPTSVGVQSMRFLYAVEDRPMITGSSLVDAQARLDPLTNAPEVAFTLDRAGGRRFAQGTGRHVGDYMAILLDNRVQGPPPVIQSEIGREGRITLAGRTIEDARDLALTLRAGALPTPLRIVEERTIGPSLGADAISSGVLAGLIGLAFVVLVIIGYYRLAGVLAVAALCVYVLMTLGALASFGAALTLPGLAGLILSIGIAVDGNVLIFERIREELAAGKTVRLAVDEGFRHALSAIVDSNVTTVLTGLFLFQFGTGPVQGFAVTLILGVIASMITAVFVTRTFFMIWLDRRPAMATLSI